VADILGHGPPYCWGHAVAQSFETLRYKPEGSGFETRWHHCDISST